MRGGPARRRRELKTYFLVKLDEESALRPVVNMPEQPRGVSRVAASGLPCAYHFASVRASPCQAAEVAADAATSARSTFAFTTATLHEARAGADRATATASHSVGSSQPARTHTQPSVALGVNAFANRVESNANNLEPILSMVRRKLAVASSMPARGGAQNSARGGASASLCSSGERSVGQSAPKVGQSAANVCGSAVCVVGGPAAAERDEMALQRVREMFFGLRPAATQPDEELSISPMWTSSHPQCRLRLCASLVLGLLAHCQPPRRPWHRRLRRRSLRRPLHCRGAAEAGRNGVRGARGKQQRSRTAGLSFEHDWR